MNTYLRRNVKDGLVSRLKNDWPARQHLAATPEEDHVASALRTCITRAQEAVAAWPTQPPKTLRRDKICEMQEI